MKTPYPQESDSADETFARELPTRHSFPWFGAITGLLAGGGVGATCGWLVNALQPMELGGIAGAAVGIFGGAAIETWQMRRAASTAERPDTATFICTLYACLPASLTFLGGTGGVQRKFTGMLMLGAVFAFPVAGALAGAVLDRLRDGGRSPGKR